MNVVSIHQPEHCPWIGYFFKIMKSDTHVVLDDVQFERNGWQNRNRIKDQNGKLFWVTVPTKSTGRLHTLINEKQIVDDRKWQSLYLDRLQHCYGKAKFFVPIYNEISDLITKNDGSLLNLNTVYIKYILKILEIETQILISSSMELTDTKNERLISICKKLKATKYLSGTGARSYLNESDFKKENIKVEFLDLTWHFPDKKIVSTLDKLFIDGPDGLRKYFNSFIN